MMKSPDDSPNRRLLLATSSALLLPLLALSGCGAVQGAKNLAKAALYPTVENLRITTQADPVTNADDRGAGLPVTVRVYQLSELKPILQSDYASLVEHDQDQLGSSLVQRYEYVVYPDGASVQEFPIKPQARYIAVLAVMRKAPAPTFYVLDATRISSGGLSFRMSAQSMVMTAGPDPLNQGNEGRSAAAPVRAPTEKLDAAKPDGKGA